MAASAANTMQAAIAFDPFPAHRAGIATEE
jgi:hypothetical protein